MQQNEKELHPNPEDNISLPIHTNAIVLLRYRFGLIYYCTVEKYKQKQS